jgi:hypothetical protein
VVATGGSGTRPGKRLTPDTGSEDEYEDDDDVEGEGEEEKDDEDEDGLLGRVKGKADAEEARSSDERLLRRRRRRRQRQLYTPEEEQAVVRKFDRKLVVFVALLYLLSFLDRSSMFTRFHPLMVRVMLTDYRYWKRPCCRHG